MSDNADHFERFRGQTRLKHFVLQSYLQSWAMVQLPRGRFRNAWFIDAFAGAGKDRQGNPGSPLIACRVSREVSGFLAKHLASPPRLNVVAIEAHAGRFKALRSAAEAFTKPVGGECLTLLRGKLADHIETVMRFGDPDEPKLFFLDPFGVQGLDASIVKRIFDRRRYEALILFSDSGAIRLDGAAQAEKHRVQTDTPIPPSLFDVLTESNDAEYEPTGGADPNESDAPATEGILRTVFGDEFDTARQFVAASSRPRVAWMYAYVRALYAWGATHVQPFSVVDEAEAHRYYLIHAATHGTATEKFKDAIREAMNRRATGASAQTSLIYSSDLNVEAIVDDLATHFAGQTVRWSDGHAPDTVKKYLLQETNALHSDLVHVRKSLDRRGWAAPGRTKIYAFPAT